MGKPSYFYEKISDMKTKRPLLLLHFFLLYFVGTCQIDTAFWFAVPEANSAHGDRPVYLRLSTLNAAANVQISIPANPSVTPMTVTIPANGSQGVDLTAWIDQLENKPADTVLSKGLFIHSTAPISSYYEIATSCQCNPEIFPLKGKNALGTNFYCPFQTNFNRSSGYQATIDIVATENNTQVTITPSKNALNHPANVPFIIFLNKGQTYSLQAAGYNGSDNFSGTRIVSNKPVAITVKEDSVGGPGGCADILGDQIVPVDLVGKEYIIIKGFLNWGEAVYFIAIENNTHVYVNGNTTPVTTINQGQTYGYTLTGNLYVNSDKPVYTYHVSGYGCELGSALLPSVACTGSSQIGFTRSTSELFSLNLITQNGNQDKFLINGAPGMVSASQFSPVTGTNGVWVSAQISFSNNQIPVNTGQIISNTGGVFHMGMINGGATSGCRYGYFSDFSSLYLGPDRQQCQGDTAILDAGVGKSFYLWSTGETTRTIRVTNTGQYWVRAGTGNCIFSDTINVGFTPAPIVSLGADTILCGGSSYTLTVPSGYAGYWWNGQPGSNSYTTTSTGTVTLKVTDANGCQARDTVHVSLPPLPLNIGGSATINLSQGLVAYYPFNGNAVDQSGNGNHGIVHGATLTTDRFGNTNSAYQFDGIGNYIDVPNSASLQINSAISLCAWINFQTGGNMNPRILHKYNYQLATLTTNSSRKIFSQFGNNNNSSIISQSYIPENNWRFVVLTYNGTEIKLYINGLPDISMAFNGPIGISNYNLTIGTNSQNFLDWFKGKIDDIRIYNRAINNDEIQCLYSGSCNFLGVSLTQDTICNNATTSLLLMNSQPAIQYQLRKNGVNYGSPQTGNGNTLSFPITNLTQTSAFTIDAHDVLMGCNSSLDTSLLVVVVPMAAPTIAGSAGMCVNSGYYYYSTEPGMSNYQWSVSPGATIIWGLGTKDLIVTWDQPGAQWIKVNYTNQSGCTALTPTQLNVTVNPVPGIAGVITGPATVCAGQTGVIYSTPLIANAVTYVWLLPPGANITGGVGTSEITVDYTASAQPGNITVYGNNLCGNGTLSPPLAINVGPLPGLAGTPVGETMVCEGDTGITYYIPPVANASSYFWEIIGGGVITSGNGTNSIHVKYPAGTGNCTITVSGINSCGRGQISPTLTVTVNPIPATPAITQNGEMLVSSAPVGNQWYLNGIPIPNATQQSCTPLQTGLYTVKVTLFGCESAMSAEYYFIMTGIDPVSLVQVMVYPVPNEGVFRISVQGIIPGFSTISIINGLGIEIRRENVDTVKGTYSKMIDLRPVPPGIYSVCVGAGLERYVRKVVIY